MTRFPVSYTNTHRFTPIVLDYLTGNGALAEMYRFRPDRTGLQEAMSERRFSEKQRAILCEALLRQYQGVPITEATRTHLEALGKPNTLTVTTGHQLCLFTGPLYVPFKILNVIRLARELSTSEREVVPIFWMATEDHDRAEIDHAWVGEKNIEWPGQAAGAVGRMKLEGIDSVLAQLDPLIGSGPNAEELRTLLRSCYRKEHTLAEATRLFVNALFGRFGLVIIDGDDAALKHSFVPLMQEELLNQVTLRTVTYANEKLKHHYPEQAHVREINLFHLRPGRRSRIELRDDRYHVLDGGPSWSMDELLVQLELNPQDFSPNVLLRPVYQETVLPNIAYVGGGGELAYWLQLRWLFQGLQVPMPALILRTSAAFLSEKTNRRWNDLGFSMDELFSPLDELSTKLIKAHSTVDLGLEKERTELVKTYDALARHLATVDPTLEGAVRAREAAAMKGLDVLGTKLMRAAKRKEHVLIDRVISAQASVFPGGGLQERRDNFLPFYAAQGPAFFDELLENLDPLDPQFSVLVKD